MRKKIVSPRKFVKPSYSALIEKKRDGSEFSEEEIRYIVDSVLDKEIPDSQLAALLMAVYFQGMSALETATFAEEMMLSGEMIDLTKLSRPKIDKFSTGGVGDKTSIVLAPLAAACGVVMPTINGVDEELEISTLQKLSSIKGFKKSMSLDAFVEQLNKVGCAIIEQDKDIAPTDSTLYSLRQKCGSIPSLPLITASVLSRKLA
ncbi:MAG: thymidine phosphorylase, partial [Puniceicoccales bacterium]